MPNRKKHLTAIFNTKTKTPILEEYDSCNYPYIGLGNPDSNTLFVGSEKAYNADVSPLIDLNERILNYAHWEDIVLNHYNINDKLRPQLMLRGALKGFNPFTPLSLADTANIVYSAGTHTYKKIQQIINSQIISFTSLGIYSDIFEITPKQYPKSTFNYCFLTDISDNPKKRQNDGEEFNYDDFKQTCRYKQISEGPLGDFYRSFKTIVIYAGSLYNGHHLSVQRNDLLKLFNPHIIPSNGVPGSTTGTYIYNATKGARIIICHQLTSRTFNTTESLEHDFSVIDMGNCI